MGRYLYVHIGNICEFNIEYLPKQITEYHLIYVLFKETVSH